MKPEVYDSGANTDCEHKKALRTQRKTYLSGEKQSYLLQVIRTRDWGGGGVEKSIHDSFDKNPFLSEPGAIFLYVKFADSSYPVNSAKASPTFSYGQSFAETAIQSKLPLLAMYTSQNSLFLH